ncbi:MAG: S1 RNA-binding domain-containing protein [Spirochaetia bacterium]|jgi:small subunit ribosomal protein S1|nr:S1 RNA-binding domain-containing protein [Spirochaetia bacterium]
MEYNISEDLNESIDMERVVADSAFGEIKPGGIYDGEVVTVDSSSVYVNIGTKSDYEIPLEEFDSVPKVGQNVRVMRHGKTFSVKAAQHEETWQNFLKNYGTPGAVIPGMLVSATNKGKEVNCGGQRAFLPFSLSADLKSESHSGEEYSFKVKSIDRKKRSVVVSRKDFIDDTYKEKWNDFISTRKAGDTVDGEIIKFVEFGAFVRIDGIDALLHRNDMSWKNVFKQRKILKLNEKRPFLILSINEADKKASLGLKQLAADPWEKIDEHISVDSIIEGVVVTVVNTGTFIEINDEIDGFLPNSEFSWTQTGPFVKNTFQKGETVKVKVIGVNKEERKLILSYRQAADNPWETIGEKFPLGSVHKSKIKKVVKFGIFVELTDGIEGLVHVSDISWDDNKDDLLKNYASGDEVEFKILAIKKDDMKVSCGIKQLKKSTWELISEKYKPKMRVEGTVSGIMQFGIFVKLEENIEGLVHISEISKHRIESLDAAFKAGDEIEAVVLSVDPKKKRISLSVKQFEYVSEQEEVNKILRETSSNTVTLGDLINLKLNN